MMLVSTQDNEIQQRRRENREDTQASFLLQFSLYNVKDSDTTHVGKQSRDNGRMPYSINGVKAMGSTPEKQRTTTTTTKGIEECC
jgi:hypothetical protein